MHSTIETTYDSSIDDAPASSAKDELLAAAYFERKERLLRPIGTLMFVCSLPLLIPLMLLVKATSRGPAVYRQRRLGKDDREFVLYKLRTMYDEAEKFTGPVWCQPNDSRVTPIGKILRRLHLDELPQLLNVARGEMDLIGPRPERPEIVEQLVGEIPGYAERTRVLPGITGVAEINLPPDTTCDSVRRKLNLDREYIRTANLALDLRMLLCTGLRLLWIRNGRAVRWLGLERAANLADIDDVRSAAASNGKPDTPHHSLSSLAENGHGRNNTRDHGAPVSHRGQEPIQTTSTLNLPRATVEARRQDPQDFLRREKPK